jgi:hypothetical protein
MNLLEPMFRYLSEKKAFIFSKESPASNPQLFNSVLDFANLFILAFWLISAEVLWCLTAAFWHSLCSHSGQLNSFVEISLAKEDW